MLGHKQVYRLMKYFLLVRMLIFAKEYLSRSLDFCNKVYGCTWETLERQRRPRGGPQLSFELRFGCLDSGERGRTALFLSFLIVPV